MFLIGNWTRPILHKNYLIEIQEKWENVRSYFAFHQDTQE